MIRVRVSDQYIALIVFGRLGRGRGSSSCTLRSYLPALMIYVLYSPASPTGRADQAGNRSIPENE